VIASMPQFGTDIGPPAGPQADDMTFQQAIQQRAREDAMKLRLRTMARGQQENSVGSLIGMGGKTLGTTISRGSLFAVAPAAPAAAASSLPAEAAGSAIAPAAGAAAPSTLSSIAGPASSVLGVAALGYGAYTGNVEAGDSIRALHEAIASGSLSKHDEEVARQKLFNAAMVKFGVGGVSGVLAGSEFGVPGMVVGGAIGGFGGAKQAYGAYDNPVDAVKAFATFQKNPFKR